MSFYRGPLAACFAATTSLLIVAEAKAEPIMVKTESLQREFGQSATVDRLSQEAGLSSEPDESKLGAKTDSPLAERLSDADTGEKIYIQSESGEINFAGRQAEIDDFSGIMGFSADVAYVVVASGSASIDGLFATRGRMIIIPPLGSSPIVARYDARRLISHASNAATMPAALNKLFTDVANSQSFGIFTGRLGRTNFNVAASGDAKDELARRSVVGGKSLRKIRFSKPNQAEKIETRVISEFTQALIDKDAASVSEFLDPLTFGDSNLNNGGTEARLLMAELLVTERDWRAALTGYETQSSDDLWILTGSGATTLLELRKTSDFIFIKSVQTKE